MNFVTGGTGLLGIHLIWKLLSEGEKVRAFKRSTSDLSWVKKVFEFKGDSQGALFSQIEWIDGDLQNQAELEGLLQGSKHIYHCAAMVSFHPKDFADMYSTNVLGTANLVNAAVNVGIEKFLHVSSVAALGRKDKGETNSESTVWKDSPLNSTYASSKYESEKEVWRGFEEGLSGAIVNPGIVIGLGDFGRSSGTLFKRVAEGLDYYPTGSNGFVSAQNVADTLYMLALSNINGERFVLVDENISYQSVLGSIAKSLKLNPPSKPIPNFILKHGWKIEWLKEKLTGKKAMLTKESLMTSDNDVSYNCDKWNGEFSFERQSLEAAIAETGAFFQTLTH